MSDILIFFLCFIAIGSLSGLLAGLFGIGGGMVIVPAMWYLTPWLHVAPSIQMPLILGTSFACIVITTFSASLSHYKLGNIQWQSARLLIPALMVTAYIASHFISQLDRHLAVKIFAGLLLALALRMLWRAKKNVIQKPFKPLVTLFAGVLIGIASSSAGIGGGGFIVPFLNARGVEIKKAIGTASVCSFALGLASTIGYVIQGYQHPELPPYSFGFIYLPALTGITFASFFTARLGAKLVTILPVATIKKAFAFFLMGVAVNMFFK